MTDMAASQPSNRLEDKVQMQDINDSIDVISTYVYIHKQLITYKQDLSVTLVKAITFD